MKNVSRLLPLLSGIVTLSGCSHAPQKSNGQNNQKPNIIYIFADDLGIGDLSCYGATKVSTPNIDRLAGQGVQFTNAYATSATSTPSRFGLLTGMYPWRQENTGIAPGNSELIIDTTCVTMADMLKDAGYATGAVGKWHLGLGPKGGTDFNNRITPNAQSIGFDYEFIIPATVDRVPCVFIENGKVANYDPSDPIEVSYTKNFPGEPTGKDNPELLYNLHPSNGHDMSIVNGISRIGFMKGGGKALWKDENIADSITVHAIDFIKQHKDEPFFMYFATNDVHVPRFPHDRFRGKNPMGLRGDAIAQFDWTVGQLMETLDQLGLTENTLIILSSDNGPVVDDGYKDKAEELLNGHTPSGPWRGNKYSAFEGGTAVPVIVRWPQKIKKTGDSDVLMSQIDWLASLGALINARLPKGSAPDSYDRLGNLIGTDKTDRPWIVEQSMNHTLSVRTKDWKYIEPNDDPTTFMKAEKIETGNLNVPQLYEMEKVSEQENVAEKYPEKVFELQTILRQVRNKRIKM